MEILVKAIFTLFCFEDNWPSKNIAFQLQTHKILMQSGKIKRGQFVSRIPFVKKKIV